jgi:hypothetical protein
MQEKNDRINLQVGYGRESNRAYRRKVTQMSELYVLLGGVDCATLYYDLQLK